MSPQLHNSILCACVQTSPFIVLCCCLLDDVSTAPFCVVCVDCVLDTVYQARTSLCTTNLVLLPATVAGLQGFDKYGVGAHTAVPTSLLQKELGLKVTPYLLPVCCIRLYLCTTRVV